MDKNSVGTQYIICECGDNFPNEDLLNIHLANDHGSVEVFQCDVCPAVFSSKPLLHDHSRSHEKTKEKPPLISLKSKTKNEKKTPPVIKLQNLKRIDSISLIQSLKGYSGLVKLESAPAQELETYQVRMEEPSQVLVKTEVQEEETTNEEIYYQCDVCNTIFYTESDFNIHYQSTHAMKVEPTTEEILEDHLVTNHILDVNVKAEAEAESEAVDTAYYYECEIAKKEPSATENVSETTGNVNETTKSVNETTENDNETIKNVNETTETIRNDNETEVVDLLVEREMKKRAGRPKKNKTGRRPIIDVYADLPPGLSASKRKRIADERRAEIRKEQRRQASKRYREKHPEVKRRSNAKYEQKQREARMASAEYAKSHPEVNRRATAKYAKEHPEVNRRASAKYAKSHPEVNRRASAKYAKEHPEVNRRASAKYAKEHPEVNRRASAKYAKEHPEVNRRASAKYAEKKRMEKLKLKANAEANVKVEIVQDTLEGSYDNLCIKEEQNIVILPNTESANGGSDLTVQLIGHVALEYSILGI